MAELIAIGAYRAGSDKVLDEAIRIYPILEQMLKQAPNECVDIENAFKLLEDIIAKPVA
jgi:flagellum-specific ATP synthase